MLEAKIKKTDSNKRLQLSGCRILGYIGLSHFISIQGDGCKFPCPLQYDRLPGDHCVNFNFPVVK